MRKYMKKGMSIFLAIVLVLGLSTSAFADTVETCKGKLAITPISDTEYLMSDGEDTGVVEIEENDGFTKIIVKENGTENYFLVNHEEGTVYSTYTGKTVVVEKEKPTVTPMGIVSTKTYKVSYKQLSDLVSSTDSAFSIASAIISLVAGAQGIAISTAASVVITLIGGGLSTIKAGIKSKSSSHGVQVVINKVEVTKHQGGRIVRGYGYKIGSIGTY